MMNSGQLSSTSTVGGSNTSSLIVPNNINNNQNSVLNSVTTADDNVREYLAFRGFMETIKVFDKECKADRSKSMQGEKIVEQLFTFLKQYEILKCMEYWRYLERKFFSQLDHNCYESVKKLEQSLKKYYVVNCIQTNRLDRCREFFEEFASELIRDEEWKDWFVLPFLKLTEVQNTRLEPYFNKHWLEMLYVSLYNFINTALMSVEKPHLLTVESDKRDRNAALKKKLNLLLHENESLKSKIMAAESYITKMEKEKEELMHRLGGGTLPSTSNTNSESDSCDTTTTNAVAQGSELSDDQHSPIATHSTNNNTDESYNLSGVTSASDLNSKNLKKRYQREFIDYGRLKLLQPKKGFSGHQKPITQCKFSGGGDFIATSSIDQTVRIWGLSGRSSSSKFECTAPVLSVDWNKKNENILLAGTSIGKIKIWNIETGKCFSEVLTDADTEYRNICDIASCPSNGQYCVASSGNSEQQSEQGALLGYNIKQMRVENRFPVPTAVTSVVFNHNGTMILTAGADGWIRVYDVNSQKAIMEWKAHVGPVTSVQLSRNETTILSTGTDNRIIHWSAHHEGRILDEIYPSFTHENNELFNQDITPRIALTSDGNEMFIYNNPSVVYSMINKKPIFSLSSPLMTALDCHSHGHEEVYLAGADASNFNLYLYSFIS